VPNPYGRILGFLDCVDVRKQPINRQTMEIKYGNIRLSDIMIFYKINRAAVRMLKRSRLPINSLQARKIKILFALLV
jgi:hypothetical protein